MPLPNANGYMRILAISGSKNSWQTSRQPTRCRRMQSHEVLKEVLKKTSAKQISADMGLSLSLIYKWAEPPQDETGSGANNPLDRSAIKFSWSGPAAIRLTLPLRFEGPWRELIEISR